MIEITVIYVQIYYNVFLVYLIRKERFPVEKTKLVWEASLRCHLVFVKLFISLVVTNSHLFLFAIIWNIAFMCIPVYNLESLNTSRWYF